MKYVYPALFTPVDGGYAIRFPDLPGTNSQGDTLENALLNAQNALECWLDLLLDENMDIPPASTPSEIQIENGQFASLIYADVDRFRRLRDNKAVKKTLTIPAWMDEKASNMGINFSRVLQDALQHKFDEIA